jgi:hypothetical protein
MKKATPTWRIELNVNCPYCDEWLDLMNILVDEWEVMPRPGETRKNIDIQVACSKCKREFTIDSIEY